MMKKKTDKSRAGPETAAYYSPFSSWQSIFVRIFELVFDLFTELHLRFFSMNRKPDRRILGVWDFYMRGGGFGDMMTFVEILGVLRHRYGLTGERNVDVCFIDDASHYNAKKPAFRKPITWKRQMMNLAHLSPYLGSVYYFKSDAEFRRFYTSNRGRYYRWPVSVSLSQPSNVHVVSEFKRKTGRIPGFVLPPETINDVYSLYEREVFPAMPVIINIRRNTRNTERNTDIAEISRFIRHFEGDREYKFIIICMKEEIPPELRKLRNVIFSKDHFSSMEHDLAFIYTSYISMFPSSGMANFAWFSDVPMINFGRHVNDPYTAPKKGELFSDHQRYFHRVEEAKWLLREFSDLSEHLKIRKLNNTTLHSHERKEYNYKF